jgi:hypothetical protein
MADFESRKGAKAMRVLAALLISALILMWAPQMSLAQEVPAPVEAPTTHEHAVVVAVDDTSYMTLQQVAIGTAVLTGAFAIGLVAGGSLSTGLAATSAVVLVYTFLP